MARRSATDLNKRYAQIRKNIEYLYKLNGKSINEVAEYIDLCDKTLRKRLQDPKQFTSATLTTLQIISMYLPIKSSTAGQQ